MSEGKRFLNKCLDTQVQTDPWPYQVIENTLSDELFLKLQRECETHLNFATDKLIQIHPDQYADYGINFYDETLDICETLMKHSKDIHGVYPNYRKYPKLGINAHIGITPPLPYKFYIHQEGLEKTWSSVTYVTPESNVGTKMYTAQDKKAFVKEAKWKPNSTFIFCGQQNKTWHSYESDQNKNRITFNLFIMKYRAKKCFYSE
jgi:hypothetical protein